MLFDEALQKIKSGQIAPVHLLYGSQKFLMDQYIQELIKVVIDDTYAEFNLERFELADQPIEVAIQAAETLPFLGDKRLVFASDAYFLTGQKPPNKTEHDLLALERYIQDPVEHAVLVIIVYQDKLDERKKIVKELKKEAQLIACQTLKEHELVPWLMQRSRVHQVELTEEAAGLLVQFAGSHLQMLHKELEKLAHFVGRHGKITPDTVQSLVSRSVEQDVFGLIDHVVHSRLQAAFQTLQELLKRNEEPIKILFLLARQFRIMFRAKEMDYKGYTQAQIAKSIGLHPYVAKLAVQQSKRFSKDELIAILDRLAEADYEMKMGKKDKALILELFFIQLQKETTARSR